MNRPITTPDKVESRIGALEFTDGMPSQETLDTVYENLDFTHALEAFMNALQGISMVSPAAGMLLSGIGSQYLMATLDANKEYFAPEQPEGVARQLDPDRPGQRLVRAAAPLWPAGAVLRQDLATQRDREGLMT